MKTFIHNLLPYCLLSLLCLVLYLPGINKIPIIDRDSPHFAQATRQMLETGNYTQINFQDHPRHLKPPGIYWLQAAAVKLFSTPDSITLWPYRLVAILGELGAVLLTFAFANSIYGRRTAFFSAALLASSLLLLIEARLIVTDAVLLATMVLMQGALWKIYIAYQSNKEKLVHWSWPLLFWLGMSAGILIKGITPLVGFLTLIALCLCDRNIRWLKATRLSWGLPLTLLLTLAWLVPISIASKSNFLLDMLKGDVAPKLAGGQQSHGMPPGFFILTFTLMFWPGSLLIWQTITTTWQNRQQSSIRFLLAWIIPTWIFFEIVPTKLPEYVLPTYPAIAVLTAYAMLHAAQQLPKIIGVISYIYYAIYVLLGLFIAASLIYIPYYFDGHYLTQTILLSMAVVIMMVAVLYCIYQKKSVHAMSIAIIITMLITGILTQFTLPAITNLWMSNKIIAAIDQYAPNRISNQSPLFTIGYNEPSLVFLLGTQRVINADKATKDQILANPELKLLLLDANDEEILRLKATQGTAQKNKTFKLLATIHGFNYSKGRWVTLNLWSCNVEK